MSLTLTKRMDLVEHRLVALEVLPDRIAALESQFLLLRDEMRAEFSAIRIEMRRGDEVIERVLREEIRAGDEETRRVLRDEIRAGDEETRTLMRILHEDVIAKIGVLQEGLNGRSRRPKR